MYWNNSVHFVNLFQIIQIVLQASNNHNDRCRGSRRGKRSDMKSYMQHGSRLDPSDHVIQHVAVSALEQRPRRSPRSSRSQKQVDPWGSDDLGQDRNDHFTRSEASLKKFHVTVTKTHSNPGTNYKHLTSHVLENMDNNPLHMQQIFVDLDSNQQQSLESDSHVARNLDSGKKSLEHFIDSIGNVEMYPFIYSDVRVKDAMKLNAPANLLTSMQNESGQFQLPLEASNNSCVESGSGGISEPQAYTDELTQEDSDVIVESDDEEDSDSERDEPKQEENVEEQENWT